eukprot:12110867-Heterocapsa_arctica.AAC.1
MATHDDLQQIERNDTQSDAFQQNKKPRKEEPLNQIAHNNLLTMLHKEEADQTQYRTVQSNKK